MKVVKASLFAVLFFLSTSYAHAMEGSDSKAMMMHEKMSKMHSSMATCLKGGKGMDACKAMAMKDCKMGDTKCKKMMSMMDESAMKMMDDGMM